MRVLSTSVAIFCVVLMWSTDGYENFYGSCPKLTPMTYFEIDKFAGEWYIIQAFRPDVECLNWNITEDDDGKWEITERRDDSIISKEYATLKEDEDDNNPAKMKVKWNLNPATQDFVVLDTDYENYAAVWMCHKVLLWHRESALILSRTPIMPVMYRQTASGKFAKQKVKVEYFKMVNQGVCVDTISTNFVQSNMGGPLASFSSDDDTSEEEKNVDGNKNEKMDDEGEEEKDDEYDSMLGGQF